MSTNAKAVGYLELNIAGFDQALKTAKNLMVTFAAGFSAYKIGEFFKDGVKGAIDFGKEMQSASRAMGGFDPGALLLTQKALEKTGMGAQEAQGHIGDFIREGRNISEMFGGSENYARALKSASQDYGSQAGVLSRSAEKLQSVWNTMESVGSKVKTFFLTATEQFVLPLQTALDYLNRINLSKVGEDFGKAISDAATMLLGIFKNGDIFEVTKLGMTVAFQEGVNWLVGGINYVAGITGPLIGKAFMKSIDFLRKAWDFFFSGSTFEMVVDGFLGVASQFSAAMLDGINTVVKVFSAGMQAAISSIQTSPEMNKFAAHLNAIADGVSSQYGDGYNYDDSYNKYLNAGKDAKSDSFDEIMNRTKGPISQDFIDDVRGSGQELAGRGGEGFKQFAENLFPQGGNGEFQKGNVFDTTESGKKLQDLIEKGFKTGTDMQDASREKHAGDEKGNKAVLNTFSGSSSKVIADSLAKVGGGGGFLRQGQTLAEKSAMQTALATKQTAETLMAMRSDQKNKTGQPALLPR
tara:strand:- start:3372 stop:4940 length:1569 start_codon:yes stop_codon:yes gene_type:complete